MDIRVLRTIYGTVDDPPSAPFCFLSVRIEQGVLLMKLYGVNGSVYHSRDLNGMIEDKG